MTSDDAIDGLPHQADDPQDRTLIEIRIASLLRMASLIRWTTPRPKALDRSGTRATRSRRKCSPRRPAACKCSPRRRPVSVQVSTQVRRSGVGWIKCRHRYSDFVKLRVALLDFLPGLELPPLPEKTGASRFAKAVIESRMQVLGDFLQWVLDHPILSTADVLVAFLQWPEAVLPSIYERSRRSLVAAPSAQRLAMERLAFLRRERASARRMAASPAEVDTPSSSTSPPPYTSTVPGATPITSPPASMASPYLRPNSLPTLAVPSDASPMEGKVRKTSNFTDALAAAMLTSVEESAVRRLQARARIMPGASARSSRVTEDLADDDKPSTTPSATGMASSDRAVLSATELDAEIAAARREVMSSSRAVASAARGESVDLACVVLQRLESIELRLQRIERSKQQGQFWGLFCCAAP